MKRYLIILNFVTAIAAAYNYCKLDCQPDPNGNKIKNIGCGRPASNCPSNVKLIDMNRSLQKLLIDGHNKIRDNVAGGSIKKFPPACRMATMKWDNDLAKQAALHVKQCTTKHDQCHRTKDFKYSGQNTLLSYHYPIGDYNEKNVLQETIEKWYNENTNTMESYIDKNPVYTGQPEYRHFTVMVRDQNTHLGCAAAIYTGSSEGTTFKGQTKTVEYVLITCNYATDNIYEKPVYARCYRAGESCKNPKKKPYLNLCPEGEQYDVNNM